MPQYPERKTFLERVLDTNDDLLTHTFTLSLASEYCKLMGSLRAAERFAEFQFQWLQLIYKTASTAEMLAFECAQADIDPGELGYQASAILLEALMKQLCLRHLLFSMPLLGRFSCISSQELYC